MNTRNIFALFLSALLTVAPVASLAALGGCQADQFATATEQTELDRLGGDLDAAKAKMDSSSAAAQKQLKDAADAAVALPTSDSAEALAENQARLVAGLEAFQEYERQWRQAVAEYEALGAEEDAVLDQIANRQAQAAGTTLGAIHPGLGLAAALGGSLLGRLGFKRSRRRIFTGIGNLIKGHGAEFFADMGKAYGIEHSSSDPKVLISTAMKMAEKSGQAELYAQLQALQDTQKTAA